MKATKDNIVSVHYTLKDTQGNVLDSSRDHEPLDYLHGHQMMIPGFEKGLEGKLKGEQVSFEVACVDGYGLPTEDAIFDVPKDQFPENESVEIGMKVNGQAESGQVQVFTVVAMTDTDYTLDGNHPLAGQDLHFDVEILDIRAASAEEISHGHVHGENDEHHD
ncbi:FKBP-type peptidyl prolyl cis-trans isomerase [Gammaproteobacteria bacterium]|nr:FKBP-type peptidyl prolyl cis-trans isomerase [Gammaproteobacteria bacterium]